MKKNARKGLALLLAGVLVITSMGYTTGNVLKAANSDNTESEQQIESGAEGTADTATTETPEVKQETIELGEKNEEAAEPEETGKPEASEQEGDKVSEEPEEEAPASALNSPEEENSEKNYTIVVGETIKITPDPEYTFSITSWTSSNKKVAKVNSKGEVDGVAAGEAIITYSRVSILNPEPQTFRVTVTEPGPDEEGYTAYLYALMPGKSMDGGGTPDSKWYGVGAVELLGVQDPSKVTLGTTVTGYRFGAVVKALYPDIRIDGVTYKYAAPGTPEASQYGYYTLSVIRAVCSNGANSGSNSYNPYVNAKTNTYHIDYSMSLNSKKTSFVNFAVKQPESDSFNAISAYAQQVNNGTEESKLKKPGAADLAPEITTDGRIYEFDGWYKDEACTAKAAFNGTIEGNTTYYARYVEKENYTITYTDGVAGEVVFSDISIKAYRGAATPTVEDPVRVGYTFAGWSPSVAETVSGNAVYTARWTGNKNTAYRVEYFYQKDGVYSSVPESSSERTGTTGAEVSVTESEKRPSKANYVFDDTADNVLNGSIAADGSLALKVYFKEQFTVGYSKGEHGSFDTQSYSGLSYGQTTPVFKGAPLGEAGYDFAGWTPIVADTVSGNMEYVAQWTEKQGIGYTVEYFYEKDGKYSDKADGYVERSGKTNEKVSVSDEDKLPGDTNYVFDRNAPNVLSGSIAGDGSLTLKVYFKEQFSVSYSQGDHGSFETQTTDELNYGAATPSFEGTPEGEPGYKFKGWAPEVADTVIRNAEYVAQWEAKNDTAYRVQFFYEKNGLYGADPDSELTRKGTTDTAVAVKAEDKKPLGDNYVFDSAAANICNGLIAGDGSLVLKLYFKEQFSVTYQPGLHGEFENQVSSGLDYGSATPEFSGEASAAAGYEFAGWSPKVKGSVTENAVYTAQWKAKEDTAYKVQYFYEKNGSYSEKPEAEETRKGTTDTEAAVTAEDKKPQKDNYVLDSTAANVTSGTIAGDGSLVLKVYFKEQFTVSYSKGDRGNFATQTTEDLAYGTATPAFAGTPTGAAGYEFTGWTPAVADKVTKSVEYVAQWKAKEDTAYKVQYFYQNRTSGEYSTQADSEAVRSGTTDQTVSVNDEDKASKRANYVFDADNSGNVLRSKLAGDGSTVLKLYFKTQFSVKYQPGLHGDFEAQETSGLDYGAATPEFKGKAAGKAGYEFEGWAPVTADRVTADVEYVAQWKAKTDTSYKVQCFYEKNGGYSEKPEFEETRKGTTDTEAAVTAEDKKPQKDNYVFDSAAANVGSGTIAGDGSLVLKLYFKEQFTISYDPGQHGSFRTQTAGGLDYGTVTPAFEGTIEGDAGYEFTGWTPEVAGTVTENKVYVAQWQAKSDTEYTVEFYYQKDGSYEKPESTVKRTGTTDTEAALTKEDKTPKAGYIIDSAADNSFTANINGDGSTVLKVYFKSQYTVTYSPGRHGIFKAQTTDGLDYGADTPMFDGTPAGEKGYDFTGWTPNVADKVSGSTEYIAQWKARSDTAYTVEYYYQIDGKYADKPDNSLKRGGTTDSVAKLTDADRKTARADFVFDSSAPNVESGTIAGDGSLVLKVYFKEQFTVSYTKGAHGRFETQTFRNIDYGAAIPRFVGTPEGEPGWDFQAWEGYEPTVTKNIECVSQWMPRKDTAYTVEYYYQDKETGTYGNPESRARREGTTDQNVSINSEDRNSKKDKYVFDADNSNNVLSAKLAGDGSTVLKLYFKLQYSVSYTKGSHGNFETQTTDELDFGAVTPEFKGTPSGDSGYSFDGWKPSVEAEVKADTEYAAQWKANNDTAYSVEYFYQKNGKYSESSDIKAQRSGTTDEKASVSDADKQPTEGGYVFDEDAPNVLKGTIAGDGSLVLKVYFKEQFSVSYTKGSHGSFETQTTDGLDYGAATPEFKGTPSGDSGYSFDGWKPETADTVTENLEYEAQWKANPDTKYTVEYLGYDGNGGWTKLAVDKRSGETDTVAEAEIRDFDGYSFYDGFTKNVLEGTVAGDGSLILKVYYRVNAHVDIIGNTLTRKYNGHEQKVEGYELSSRTEVEGVSYKASKLVEKDENSSIILLNEKASVSKVASGKDAGIYKMGLEADQFINTDDGFNAEINIVSDGQLEITKRKVILTSASDSKFYDGEPLICDRVTVSGDGFVKGEGFAYQFTGARTKVGKSNNSFKYIITEEYQNTNPDNYDVELVYGVLEVKKNEGFLGLVNNTVPERRIINQIADGDSSSLTEIAGGEVPLAKQMLDANCCILHLILMLGALVTMLAYTRDIKKRQKRIYELEETLAQAGAQE